MLECPYKKVSRPRQISHGRFVKLDIGRTQILAPLLPVGRGFAEAQIEIFARHDNQHEGQRHEQRQTPREPMTAWRARQRPADHATRPSPRIENWQNAHWHSAGSAVSGFRGCPAATTNGHFVVRGRMLARQVTTSETKRWGIAKALPQPPGPITSLPPTSSHQLPTTRRRRLRLWRRPIR